MKKENKYSGLKTFFNKNSGLFTVLSIFLIFLSVSGRDFLPAISGVKLTVLSEFLWFAGVLIAIICLIVLVKESWIKENPKSIKIFGAILFLALFCSSMYVFFAILLSENIFIIFTNFPSALLVSLAVMISPFIFVLINKIKVKWVYWAIYILVPVLALLFLLVKGGIQNWSNKLISKNILYWFAFAVIISFFWTLYYKISDWRSKKKA